MRIELHFTKEEYKTFADMHDIAEVHDKGWGRPLYLLGKYWYIIDQRSETNHTAILILLLEETKKQEN